MIACVYLIPSGFHVVRVIHMIQELPYPGVCEVNGSLHFKVMGLLIIISCMVHWGLVGKLWRMKLDHVNTWISKRWCLSSFREPWRRFLLPSQTDEWCFLFLVLHISMYMRFEQSKWERRIQSFSLIWNCLKSTEVPSSCHSRSFVDTTLPSLQMSYILFEIVSDFNYIYYCPQSKTLLDLSCSLKSLLNAAQNELSAFDLNGIMG